MKPTKYQQLHACFFGRLAFLLEVASLIAQFLVILSSFLKCMSDKGAAEGEMKT